VGDINPTGRSDPGLIPEIKGGFIMQKKKGYRGIVKDKLGSMETRLTKVYDTYKDAHEAAEKLCKQTMGDRGEIDVKEDL